MAISQPTLKPDLQESIYATGAITGARFVMASGAPGPDGNYGAAQATAGVRIIGVSANDIPINTVGLIYAAPGTVAQVTAGVNLAVGDRVESNATGQAIVIASGVAAGVVRKAALSGELCEIKIN